MSLHRSIIIFLAGAILLTFLTRIPSLADPTHVGRFVMLSICCAWGILAILPRLKKVTLDGLDGVFLSFYLLNLVSISWAGNFGEAVFTSQKYLLLWLCYLLFKGILREHKKYQQVLANLLIAMTLVALSVTTFQLLQQAGETGLGGKALYLVRGFSGHKNLAASILFLLFGLNVYFLLDREKHRPLIYALLLWQLVVMLLLRSRSVYLAMGLFAVLQFIAFVLSSAELRQLALRRVLPIGVLVLLIGGGAIYSSGVANDYLKYLNPATYSQTASAKERQFVWHKTWDLIQDKPLAGYGSGSWKLYFPSKNISGGFRLQEKDLVFTRAHNDFLEVWAEVGLFGFLLYALLFGLPLLVVLSVIRQLKAESQVKAATLIATLLGFALISYFDFPKERMEHLVLFGLLLALLTYGYKKARFHSAIFTIHPHQRYFLVGGLSLFLAINIPLGYSRLTGEYHSKQIMVYKNSDRYDIIKAEVAAANSLWYSVDALVVPFNWYRGIAEYKAGDFEAALGSFADAYAINPYNFNVINNYGSTLVQVEEYEKATQVYLQALEINPKFDEGMFNIAFAYYKQEKYDEALHWINQIGPNADQEKRASYKQQITAAQAAANN